MFFEARVDPPPTSPEYRPSADAFLAGRVRDARMILDWAGQPLVPGDLLLGIDVLRAEAEPARAIALSIHGARLFPDDASVALEAALAFVSTGRVKRADAMLARIRIADVGDARVVVDAKTKARVIARRAVHAAARGLFDDAKQHAAAAVAAVGAGNGNDDPFVAYSLAYASELARDFDVAIEHGERARRLAPRWRRCSIALCEALLARGRDADADRVLREALASADEDANVELYAAFVDLARGDDARAADRLVQARARWTSLRDSRDNTTLAVLTLWSAGRFDDAKDLAKRTLAATTTTTPTTTPTTTTTTTAAAAAVSTRRVRRVRESSAQHTQKLLARFVEAKPGKRKVLAAPRVAQQPRMCMPTAVSIACAAQGISITPEQLADKMGSHHGTQAWRALEAMRELGWRVEHLKPDVHVVRGLLDRGIAPLGLLSGLFEGHVEVLVGYDAGLEAIVIRDPMHWQPIVVGEKALEGRHDGDAVIALIAPGQKLDIDPSWRAQEAAALDELERLCAAGSGVADRLKAEQAYARVKSAKLAARRDVAGCGVVITPAELGRRERARVGDEGAPLLDRVRALFSVAAAGEDVSRHLGKLAESGAEIGPVRFILLARMHLAKGRALDAQELLDDNRDRLEGSEQYWLARADVDGALGDSEAARRSLSMALQIDPTNPQARARMRDYADVQPPVRARLKELDLELSRRPDDAGLLVERAELVLELGDSRAFADAFTRIIARRPRWPALVARLASFYVSQGREDLAGPVLDAARPLLGDETPGSPPSHEHDAHDAHDAPPASLAKTDTSLYSPSSLLASASLASLASSSSSSSSSLAAVPSPVSFDPPTLVDAKPFGAQHTGGDGGVDGGDAGDDDIPMTASFRSIATESFDGPSTGAFDGAVTEVVDLREVRAGNVNAAVAALRKAIRAPHAPGSDALRDAVDQLSRALAAPIADPRAHAAAVAVFTASAEIDGRVKPAEAVATVLATHRPKGGVTEAWLRMFLAELLAISPAGFGLSEVSAFVDHELTTMTAPRSRNSPSGPSRAMLEPSERYRASRALRALMVRLHVATGAYVRAVAAARALLDEAPDDDDVRATLAHALALQNDLVQAAVEADRAVAGAPGHVGLRQLLVRANHVRARPDIALQHQRAVQRALAFDRGVLVDTVELTATVEGAAAAAFEVDKACESGLVHDTDRRAIRALLKANAQDLKGAYGELCTLDVDKLDAVAATFVVGLKTDLVLATTEPTARERHEAIEEGLARLPDNPRFIRAQADFWLERKQAQAAHTLVEQAMLRGVITPDLVAAWVSAGNTPIACVGLLDRHDFAPRRRALALSLAAAIGSGRAPSAANALRGWVEHNAASDVELLLATAEALLHNGELERGEALLSVVRVCDPANVVARQVQASVEESRNDVAALKQWRALIDDTGTAGALARAAKVSLRLSRPEEAEALARRALKMSPRFPTALGVLGRIRLDRDVIGPAIEWSSQGIPVEAEWLCVVAVDAAKSAQRTVAKKWFEAAVARYDAIADNNGDERHLLGVAIVAWLTTFGKAEHAHEFPHDVTRVPKAWPGTDWIPSDAAAGKWASLKARASPSPTPSSPPPSPSSPARSSLERSSGARRPASRSRSRVVLPAAIAVVVVVVAVVAVVAALIASGVVTRGASSSSSSKASPEDLRACGIVQRPEAGVVQDGVHLVVEALPPAVKLDPPQALHRNTKDGEELASTQGHCRSVTVDVVVSCPPGDVTPSLVPFCHLQSMRVR